jgi:hypothetical protein
MPWRNMGEWRYSSTILGSNWSASRPGCFTPGERAHGTQWIGCWVSPRASMEAVEKRNILHCQELNPGHPAHSLLLYQLSYPNSSLVVGAEWKLWEFDIYLSSIAFTFISPFLLSLNNVLTSGMILCSYSPMFPFIYDFRSCSAH